MSRILKLIGGPLDGDYRDIWPELLTGYTPARHNGRAWVAHWMYPRGGRRGWCVEGCDTDHCPNYAPPPPAGGTA